MPRLIATVNGPGELSGWLLPVLERLKATAPHVRTAAVITPCQYAARSEREVAAAAPWVDDAYTVWSFVRREWANRNVRTTRDRSLVVHFGGDPIYSRLVAAASGAVAWRYGTSAKGAGWIERFMVPTDKAAAKVSREGIPPNRITVVGQLVVDSVGSSGGASGNDVPGGQGGGEESTRVLLLPGSRRFEVEPMVPFFVQIIDETCARRPGATFLMSRSSYVGRDEFTALAIRAGCRALSNGDGLELLTPGGHRCTVVDGGRWHEFAGSDGLALSLPGTNTLQLAACGTPTIVLLPLNWGERIPLEGLPGLLLPSRLPFGLAKRYLTRALNRRIKYTALPNILADAQVVPELRGVLRAGQVADEIASWLDDRARRAATSRRLREIAGPPGASTRLVAAILENLGVAERAA